MLQKQLSGCYLHVHVRGHGDLWRRYLRKLFVFLRAAWVSSQIQ